MSTQWGPEKVHWARRFLAVVWFQGRDGHHRFLDPGRSIGFGRHEEGDAAGQFIVAAGGRAGRRRNLCKHRSHRGGGQAAASQQPEARLVRAGFGVGVASLAATERGGTAEVTVDNQVADLVSDGRGHLLVVQQVDQRAGQVNATIRPAERARRIAIQHPQPDRFVC